MDNTSIEQAMYNQLLKDEAVKCTCDEVIRETDRHQAEGHYHHCMLYQLTRALKIGQMFERENIRVSVDLWQLSDSFLKQEDYERLMRIITKKG